MAYNSISIKPYIKSHLELQRGITLIKLAPSPYFFVLSICLAYMNMFARFDENPALTLQDIKETKCYGPTHGCTDNVKTVYPPQSLWGVKISKYFQRKLVNIFLPIDFSICFGCSKETSFVYPQHMFW